jgi:hypothetical protein
MWVFRSRPANPHDVEVVVEDPMSVTEYLVELVHDSRQVPDRPIETLTRSGAQMSRYDSRQQLAAPNLLISMTPGRSKVNLVRLWTTGPIRDPDPVQGDSPNALFGAIRSPIQVAVTLFWVRCHPHSQDGADVAFSSPQDDSCLSFTLELLPPRHGCV